MDFQTLVVAGLGVAAVVIYFKKRQGGFGGSEGGIFRDKYLVAKEKSFARAENGIARQDVGYTVEFAQQFDDSHMLYSREF